MEATNKQLVAEYREVGSPEWIRSTDEPATSPVIVRNLQAFGQYVFRLVEVLNSGTKIQSFPSNTVTTHEPGNNEYYCRLCTLTMAGIKFVWLNRLKCHFMKSECHEPAAHRLIYGTNKWYNFDLIEDL